MNLTMAQQKRFVLAGFEGWTLQNTDGEGMAWHLNGIRSEEAAPDYDSLDDIHRIEKRLDVNQLSFYADKLDELCVPTHICPTVEQRRDALYQTLGRVVESKKP